MREHHVHGLATQTWARNKRAGAAGVVSRHGWRVSGYPVAQGRARPLDKGEPWTANLYARTQ